VVVSLEPGSKEAHVVGGPPLAEGLWRRAKFTNCVRSGSISALSSSMRRSAVSTYWQSRRRQFGMGERAASRRQQRPNRWAALVEPLGRGCAAARRGARPSGCSPTGPGREPPGRGPARQQRGQRCENDDEMNEQHVDR
jgi:hypothetical protein